ncbi:MAG: anhydro-N-acetylmuramic acid kinase, partial [Candidatus Eisenbacteria sp.]|nr:anhydro-N-acetylmuramic acid kinase [Candidatus Eisenbacteria bacterium]
MTPGEKLSAIASLDERFVIGLSSGTSFDGIDAALVRINGCGDDIHVELLSFVCVAFEPALRERIARSGGSKAPELTRLNFDVGEAFAAAALTLAAGSGRGISEIHLIGSHGQTVYHDPPSGGRSGATLQIGEADVIAGRTGLVTVADFRTADVAAGGSGAPLVPLVDWLLFRKRGEARILLNIGGIANMTCVTERLEDVLAFDTGPGNALIDELVRAATGVPDAIDAGGARALHGTPDVAAADAFLAHPYFAAAPRKSTGKETFGSEAAVRLAELVHPGTNIAQLAQDQLSDLLATAVSVSARSIRDAVRFLPADPSRVIVSGGGLRNLAMMSELKLLFDP